MREITPMEPPAQGREEMEETIREGDDILLYLDRKRKYLLRVEKDKVFHSHKGFIHLQSLIGRRFGSSIESSMGVEFTALKPTIKDYIQKILRRTQIIYPKDMALIIVNSNISPGSRVVEAGTGSGALTSLLAYYVRPNGRVYSYEVREEFLEVARRNLKRVGLSEMVELKNKDITQGIDEVEIDTIVLDMATPWLVVDHAHEALRGSGFLISFSPTIEQVVKTVEAMEKRGFTALETVECLTRRFQVKTGQTRPETLMIGHTGYITSGRKIVI